MFIPIWLVVMIVIMVIWLLAATFEPDRCSECSEYHENDHQCQEEHTRPVYDDEDDYDLGL